MSFQTFISYKISFKNSLYYGLWQLINKIVYSYLLKVFIQLGFKILDTKNKKILLTSGMQVPLERFRVIQIIFLSTTEPQLLDLSWYKWNWFYIFLVTFKLEFCIFPLNLKQAQEINIIEYRKCFTCYLSHPADVNVSKSSLLVMSITENGNFDWN